MRPPPFFVLPLLLLLAGCAADHSGHAGHGLLFGVVNAGDADTEVGWTVTMVTSGTVVWNEIVDVAAGKTVERIHALNTTGEHRIDLSWGEGRNASATFDASACRGQTHIVLELHADGTTKELTRECH